MFLSFFDVLDQIIETVLSALYEENGQISEVGKYMLLRMERQFRGEIKSLWEVDLSKLKFPKKICIKNSIKMVLLLTGRDTKRKEKT